METDRPSVTLFEGGADVSYQVRVSRVVPGFSAANVHISPNPRDLYGIDKIRPGPWDGDRFVYRDPGPHHHGDSASLVVGAGGWSTVTFAAGHDDDAHNHALTLYHRTSPRGHGWSGDVWPRLDGPDSRWFTDGTGRQGTSAFPALASGCYPPADNVACWTWPVSVRIVDDDKWEQEVVYARHDPAANGGAGGPGAFVRASEGGLRAALPAALAPGSSYTFYVRLAVDPAALPKDGTVQRDVEVTEGGVTRRVDVYPPTFLPKRVPVWVRVKGARADRHGVPDVRLRITPHATAGVRPNSGAYFITDTSGTRPHPSMEAEYDYRANTPPGAKGSSLFWDEPMAVTIEVRADAPLGAVRRVEVNSDSGLLTRPGCGRGWSKHNCTGDHYGYWFWDGWDIAVGLVEDLRPAAQRSAAGFSPRTPEEALEWAKQANFGNEGEPFTPFADVSAGGGGAGGGERASVTEGEAARFTVSLTPPPSGPRAVTVNVARRGGSAPLGVEAHLGPRTVMVGPSGSAQFEVPTADNDHVGHNGYLHAVVAPHPAYRVSAFGGSAEVDVLSDDAEAAPDAVRVRRVTDTAATVEWDPSPGAASYEVIWIEGASTTTSTAFTAGTSIELSGLEPATAYDVAVLDDLWDRVGSAELLTLPAGGGEKVYPTLNVAAGAGVAEGAAATFTLTAAPAPEAPFAVTVWVSQRGHYAAEGARGKRSVTIPTSGSVSFEVATADDTADEPDGAIIVTLKGYEFGYMLATSRAEVAVADDDDGSAAPEVSVAAGGPVAEGTAATFTVTADPAPAAPLTVNVTVSQDGDYGAATGARTVTIPT
ncbi:MAG: fibronectin type III domain-containing protein, partial [Acidimicrobiia bacterium]|nr:fibronectin type III domain-containing protein [Acidimicrobiia bacterium]